MRQSLIPARYYLPEARLAEIPLPNGKVSPPPDMG